MPIPRRSPRPTTEYVAGRRLRSGVDRRLRLETLKSPDRVALERGLIVVQKRCTLGVECTALSEDLDDEQRSPLGYGRSDYVAGERSRAMAPLSASATAG